MFRLFIAGIITVVVTAVLFVCLAWLAAPAMTVCGGGDGELGEVEGDDAPTAHDLKEL
jgi:hypothetical protein